MIGNPDPLSQRNSSVGFSSSTFYRQSFPFGPLFRKLIFFEFCFEFAELFEFEYTRDLTPGIAQT
jgi:hypothetical protein